MKILLIANKQKWKSWNKKIKEIQDWFAPVAQFQIDLIHSDYSNIPFEEYGVHDGVMRYGIAKKWYKDTIFSNKHDITIFSVNRTDWKAKPVEGWHWDRGSIALAANETGQYNFKGVRYSGGKWFNLARHELCHALYTIQGKVDRTHFHWDSGDLSKVLDDLVKPKPTILNSIINTIMPSKPKKYKYFSDKEVVGLKPELVDLLDKARDIAGVPFVIGSGLRTPEQNKKAGGVKDSAHLSGYAVDLSCRDSSNRYKIITALLKVGFNRIGVDDTFVHCDIDPSKPQNVIWTYK